MSYIKKTAQMPCLCGPCSRWILSRLRVPESRYPLRVLVLPTPAADFVLTEPRPEVFILQWGPPHNNLDLPRGKRAGQRSVTLKTERSDSLHTIKEAALAVATRVLNQSINGIRK